MTKVYTQNRLHNAKNPNQGTAKRVLCVCSAGLLRSPTAAFVLASPPFNFNTRAVGAHMEWALIPIDDTLIHWADEIVVMQEMHEELITSRHIIPQEKRIFVLDIPDIYERMDPELQELIKTRYMEVSDYGRSEGPI